MIRSSKHTIKFTNLSKLERYRIFIAEYRRMSQIFLNYIWRNGYQNFNIHNDNFELPQFIRYPELNIDYNTTLNGRALSSCITQVSGIIRSVSEKIRRKLWKLNNLKNLKPNIKYS